MKTFKEKFLAPEILFFMYYTTVITLLRFHLSHGGYMFYFISWI